MPKNKFILKIIFYLFLLPVVGCWLRVTNFVFAQTLEGPDVQLEIKNLDFEVSDKPLDAPRPPEKFTKQGYIIQTLPPETTVSRPFATDPGAYLLRAKPGTSIDIPLTVHNFKDAAVLQLETYPFVEPANSPNFPDTPRISIDCARVKVSSCAALEWVNNKEQEKFFIESGEEKQINFSLSIPETAPEGDYYLSFRISAYNKPYQYTSSLLYLTITNSGITPSNILLFPKSALLLSSGDFLKISAQNGSGYFELLHKEITIKSPLGFTKNISLPKTVLLANQTKIINIPAKNLPLGPAKIIYDTENKKSKWIIVFPSF